MDRITPLLPILSAQDANAHWEARAGLPASGEEELAETALRSAVSGFEHPYAALSLASLCEKEATRAP